MFTTIFACCFEWENGVKTHSYARQMKGCFNDVNDYVVGTEGTAKVLSFFDRRQTGAL